MKARPWPDLLHDGSIAGFAGGPRPAVHRGAPRRRVMSPEGLGPEHTDDAAVRDAARGMRRVYDWPSDIAATCACARCLIGNANGHSRRAQCGGAGG